MTKSKLQTPSSNRQRKSKHQISKFWLCASQVWNLEFEISLELGCWELGFLRV